ncbi:HAMP domain-containing histidine kinase [Streptomyces sp. NBC_00513]|uniref:sensor histidine kinase n=1 Tax=unclassified Streptomyces TaxID=2593676 RepID=UPI002254F4AF|nr:HAMP domain-containing sensor histidine kinase [Streptomyces sp. NBC_00424]MCX5071106.1 HAMP domain-containing histidine kinase [Streptomyces sp. NBC_00424]WUD45471.1 HAMP domain-containing histidine kinase [Streptomyces sp. NBC_00513]
MHRRLLVIVCALVAGLIVALSVPLVRATADRTIQTSFTGRVQDSTWFADMAATALETGRTARLQAAADRYTTLYDSQVAIVDADRKTAVVAPHPVNLEEPAVRSALLQALADRPPERPSVVWPWDHRPFIHADAIKRDGHILGAVLIVSPTDQARSDVADYLTLVILASLTALAIVLIAVATPVVRWVLRPVHELDRATHEVALGRLKTHVSDRAGAPELRRLANSFNAMADSMHASQEQQRAFVAQASHQLRNPLTALRLRVENLEDFVNDPEGLHELHSAVEEADRFGQMLDGLLRMARAEASEAERTPVDVSTVVAHRADAWRAAFAAEGVPLTTRIPPGISALSLPECLDQALDTLLDNALKFADGSPVDIRVTRAPHDPGRDTTGLPHSQPADNEHGIVEVSVEDQGSGLTTEELAQAGSRFWRSTRHQNVPGTGLGLALTRILVEAGGGELRLAAAHPHGLTVTIRLPAAPQASPTTDPQPPAGTP